MQEIKLEINEQKKGAFILEEEGQRIGEMVISITGDIMIVDHTEVKPEWEGKGMARKLLNAMVDHARTNQLKVLPVCPYTLAVFRKDPQSYQDVWYKKEVRGQR